MKDVAAGAVISMNGPVPDLAQVVKNQGGVGAERAFVLQHAQGLGEIAIPGFGGKTAKG